MPRLTPDITITFRDHRRGESERISLIRQPCGQRVWVRRNGRKGRLEEATVTEVFRRLRGLAVRRLMA